jgi:hypothetical protein
VILQKQIIGLSKVYMTVDYLYFIISVYSYVSAFNNNNHVFTKKGYQCLVQSLENTSWINISPDIILSHLVQRIQYITLTVL